MKDRLIELLDMNCGYTEEMKAEDMADYLIENNVVIQKHGQWYGEADGYADGELVYDVWYCSECNNCIDRGIDDPELLPKFCEECGAKMDGD